MQCDIEIPSLGTDAEGKLVGGFTGIDHLSVMGLPLNNKLTNKVRTFYNYE